MLIASLAAPAATTELARAYVGTLWLNVSDNTPRTDSVLPFFQFMNDGNEGGIGFSYPPVDVPQPALKGLADSLPDYLLNETHVMRDLRDKQLPWRMKDGGTTQRTPRDVRVATLENDQLRVDMTPLWGGRVHRALHKPTGRYLSYFSGEHQSVNDGVLRPCELGGIEWNWAPGQAGHAAHSENPGPVARPRPARRGAPLLHKHRRYTLRRDRVTYTPPPARCGARPPACRLCRVPRVGSDVTGT